MAATAVADLSLNPVPAVADLSLNPVPEDTGERRFHALSFGSTVAHLWINPREAAVTSTNGRGFHESDLVCGMLGARAEL